jgi:transposase InsO family protein
MKHLLARALIELTRIFAAAHGAAMAGCGDRRVERMARDAIQEATTLERDLLRARLQRLDSAKRPRYLPQERLQILLYRARYGVSLGELARRFVLSVETIKEWMVEVDGGVEQRVKTAEPVNKLSGAVREVAVLLRWEQLAWGAKRIADVLRQMKLKISRTSVQRILRRNPRRPAVKAAKPKRRHVGIRAKRENHVWLVDLTHVVGFMGLLRVRVVAIMDAYTRAIVATGVSTSEPTAEWMCRFFSKAIGATGAKPDHLISDRGSQFTAHEFQRMLRRRKIRHRFGAVGAHGSCSLIERLMRTLKRELLNATCVWLNTKALQWKLDSYADWFNEARPHQGLRGRTPHEVAARTRRAKPMTISKGDVLRVTRRDLHGEPRLPVYSLRVRKSA